MAEECLKNAALLNADSLNPEGLWLLKLLCKFNGFVDCKMLTFFLSFFLFGTKQSSDFWPYNIQYSDSFRFNSLSARINSFGQRPFT